MIEITGLRKVFRGRHGPGGGDVEAFSGIDLTVRDNEFLTIIGPSGCGKTSLLRAIAGILPTDGGEIRIDGDLVTGPARSRAMVFQNIALLPWMTVLDNVGFGLEVRGVAKKERDERSREYLQMVGLEGWERRMPGELSGGMQQRVGLARALAVRPKLLLMDEPFGSLDEQTRRLLQEELLAIWEANRITVVFITHSMTEAVLLGDRVALMGTRPGRIVDIVPVPLVRPRSASVDEVGTSEVFQSIASRLWQHLRDVQPDLQLKRAVKAGVA